MKTWGYGQDPLEEAVKRGLVEKFKGKCASRRLCVFNMQTEKGEEVLKLLGKIFAGRPAKNRENMRIRSMMYILRLLSRREYVLPRLIAAR